jgi:hypothetical protein
MIDKRKILMQLLRNEYRKELNCLLEFDKKLPRTSPVLREVQEVLRAHIRPHFMLWTECWGKWMTLDDVLDEISGVAPDDSRQRWEEKHWQIQPHDWVLVGLVEEVEIVHVAHSETDMLSYIDEMIRKRHIGSANEIHRGEYLGEFNDKVEYLLLRLWSYDQTSSEVGTLF